MILLPLHLVVNCPVFAIILAVLLLRHNFKCLSSAVLFERFLNFEKDHMDNFCILGPRVAMQNFTVCMEIQRFVEFKIEAVRHVGLYRK